MTSDHALGVHGLTSRGPVASDAHLQRMLLESPAVLYSCGPPPDHPTTFISENIRGQLGYTPAEFSDDPFFWTKLIHPDDSDMVLATLARVQDDDRANYEYRIRHRDGHYLWIHDQLSAVRDASGDIVMLVGSWFDVTERKKTEAILREQRRLDEFGLSVRVAFDHSRPLRDTLRRCAEAMVVHLNVALARIWILNHADNMLELKASAGMYTHCDGDHGRIPMGKLEIGMIAQERRPHLTNAVIGDPRIDNQKWAKREAMVAFAGYPLEVERQVVGVMAMFSREPLPRTILTGMSSIAAVIALGVERKRTEASLRRSERLVSIGTLAAGLAHEINNPLTTISLITERALSTKDNTNLYPDAATCFGRILEASERCTKIIASVLQFSRTGTTAKMPCDLAEIIRNSADLVLGYAKQHGARIETEIDTSLPRVPVNAGQVEQLLVNLIRNSVESGGRGNRVLIRLRRVADAMLILVRDEGCGMTSEQQRRMFDPFYTTRSRKSGTGMGLSIVHGIVLAHGGTIEVESEVGHGTTIAITLPLTPGSRP